MTLGRIGVQTLKKIKKLKFPANSKVNSKHNNAVVINPSYLAVAVHMVALIP